MNAITVMDHELVGIDAEGSLCACGDKSADWLEHLGMVALALMGAPESHLQPKLRASAEPVDPWEAKQLRESNLASFRNMTEVWGEELPARVRRPRPTFTDAQLAIAAGVLERKAAA